METGFTHIIGLTDIEDEVPTYVHTLVPSKSKRVCKFQCL